MVGIKEQTTILTIVAICLYMGLVSVGLRYNRYTCSTRESASLYPSSNVGIWKEPPPSLYM